MKLKEIRESLDANNISPLKAALEIGMCLVGALDGSNDFDPIADIKAFHEKFGQIPEREMTPKMREFRTKFLKEELAEWVAAAAKNNRADMIDALFDIVYIALGTAHLMEVDFAEVWKEGHSSNMTKTPVKKGRGKYGMTVVKGDTYRPPNFQDM